MMILLQQVTEGQWNKNKSRPGLLGEETRASAITGYIREGMKIWKERADARRCPPTVQGKQMDAG
jgi:hypothetical protein